jgi:alpha-beta hydrolase superfamily lysophospholipase
MTITTEVQYVDNGAGYELALKRISSAKTRPGSRPVILVPGYGMNAFVFGFHPSGLSLEESLAAAGLEVWSAELRGQGKTRALAGAGKRFGLGELAVDDLPVVVEHVRRRTSTGAAKVDLVGCSLGTALSFAYLAHQAAPPVHSVVAFGGLVTWVKVHPLLRAAFASPWIAGKVELSGTRALARVVLPAIARMAPSLLSIYLNVASTDVRRADELVQTVEDPNSLVNEEIAHWIKAKELTVRGVNVSRALGGMQFPLLCVVAKDDGIVPEETARDVFHSIGAKDKELLVVGGGPKPIAHADLFLSEGAQARIFDPVAEFLLLRGDR